VAQVAQITEPPCNLEAVVRIHLKQCPKLAQISEPPCNLEAVVRIHLKQWPKLAQISDCKAVQSEVNESCVEFVPLCVELE
jgi:hypothetical protein